MRWILSPCRSMTRIWWRSCLGNGDIGKLLLPGRGKKKGALGDG
jgi:hypothetical protein